MSDINVRTSLPVLANAIYGALGAPASILGSGYRVYRLNAQSSQSVIGAQSLLYSSFPAYGQRTISKQVLENQVFDLVAFTFICDATKLHVGDIMVETNAATDDAAYCIAEIRMRPPFRVVAVRVESGCAIERPHPEAGAADDQPTSGLKKAVGYGGLTVEQRRGITLNGGLYGMSSAGQGVLASIPIGLQQTSRVGEGHNIGLPTTFPTNRFTAYIPPLPGYIMSELDIIKAQNGDSYQISQMDVKTVGLQGTVAILQKLAT